MDQLNKKIAETEAMQEEIKLLKRSQLEMLEKISGFTVEEAKDYLIKNIESEVTHQAAMKIKEIEAKYRKRPTRRPEKLLHLPYALCRRPCCRGHRFRGFPTQR